MINAAKNTPGSPSHRLAYYWEVVQALIGRDFAMRYKGSTLGLLWAVLSPLAMAAILYVVFTRIVPLGIPHYSTYVFTGLLPWTWFSGSVLTGAASLLSNRDLVRKPFFAKPVLPVVVVGTHFLLYMLALPVLFGSLLVEGLAPTATLLLLPILWAVQALLTLAVTMLVAALSVIVPDMRHLLEIVLILWFYLTPIFYDVRLLPAETARYFVLNPLAVIIKSHRDVSIAGLAPDWLALGITTATALIVFVLAYAVFRLFDDVFVEEL
jgi:lipopolysaccharide transport system permease protein